MGENGLLRFVQICEQREALAFSDFLLSANFATEPRSERKEVTRWEEKQCIVGSKKRYHKVIQGLDRSLDVSDQSLGCFPLKLRCNTVILANFSSRNWKRTTHNKTIPFLFFRPHTMGYTYCKTFCKIRICKSDCLKITARLLCHCTALKSRSESASK